MKGIRKIPVLFAIGYIFAILFSFSTGPAKTALLSREQLGEKLFFDPLLSLDRTLSCASCHKPAFAFADTVAFSSGIYGQKAKRNTPSVTNMSGRPRLFWDGRSASLEDQAIGPITSAEEMNLPVAEAVNRLRNDKEYAAAFAEVYNSAPTEKLLTHALASYERTLETADTPYDRYINGDDNALTEAAKRGRMLFIGKANCANCHSGEDFTANRFKNIGLFNGIDLNDAGRFVITKDSAEIGAFKIPGLRNVAITAPYMHNGQFATLKEVVEYYNQPDKIVANSIRRDLSLEKPLGLSETEVIEIVSFLESLTDDRFVKNNK